MANHCGKERMEMCGSMPTSCRAAVGKVLGNGKTMENCMENQDFDGIKRELRWLMFYFQVTCPADNLRVTDRSGFPRAAQLNNPSNITLIMPPVSS